MRDTTQIKRDIEALRYEIRLAQRENSSDRETEELYNDLEELNDELDEVRAMESSMRSLQPLQV